MARKRYSAEEIVNKLRQAEVELSKGSTGAQVSKQIGVIDQTYYKWRREHGGLKTDQAKRFKQLEQENARLWLSDGSCVRLRAERRDHVWSYDFVQDRRADGRAFWMLTVIDEHTQECLAIDVARKLRSDDVLERMAWLMATRGVPEHVRSDNGAEFTAMKVRRWMSEVGVKRLVIEPGSPWENGYVESFNGKLRDELLAREQLDTLKEARVLIERWRRHYNTQRPHSSLGYRPPAPEAIAEGPCSATLRTPLLPHTENQLHCL